MKPFFYFLLLAGLWLALASPTSAAAPTTDERLADVQAHIENASRSANSALNVPGPGHNAWMMTSSALALLMILPGLALFYGGLVRRKNVLSVLAQCLGLAGVVALLWWAVGYTLVFGKAMACWAVFLSPFSTVWMPIPTRITRAGHRIQCLCEHHAGGGGGLRHVGRHRIRAAP